MKTETLSKKKIKLADKEFERLSAILKAKEIDDDYYKIAIPLIREIAFMKVELDFIKEDIRANGTTEEYKNGENQYGRKKSAAADVYNTMIKNFATLYKQLNSYLPEQEKAAYADDFEDFKNQKSDF